jgi:hypothetical protein
VPSKLARSWAGPKPWNQTQIRLKKPATSSARLSMDITSKAIDIDEQNASTLIFKTPLKSLDLPRISELSHGNIVVWAWPSHFHCQNALILCNYVDQFCVRHHRFTSTWSALAGEHTINKYWMYRLQIMCFCPAECINIVTTGCNLTRHILIYNLTAFECICCNLCGISCPVSCIFESNLLLLISIEAFEQFWDEIWLSVVFQL